jgi:hypothetical protein
VKLFEFAFEIHFYCHWIRVMTLLSIWAHLAY